mgnify:CR=1 FL=1
MNYTPYNTDLFLEIVQGKNIFVYGDPDTDGVVATYFVIEQLEQRKIPYTYYINNDREHGFKLPDSDLEKLKGCAIIAVDFHMSKEEVQHVVDYGINIVVMDHHELENANEAIVCTNSTLGTKGIVICNQYAFEPEQWRFLSGAGVVYSVFSALDEQYSTQKHKAYVGITLLSDSRAIESAEAQQYLDAVYSWRDTESMRLIRAVQTEKQRNCTFGVQKYLDRDFLDFTFNPTFNALCRFNKHYTALAILLDLNTSTDVCYYKTQQVNIRDYLHSNCHITTLDGFLICHIEVTELDRSEINYANFIGLLANFLLGTEERSVVIYITDNGRFVRGSVRGKCTAVDYLSAFKSCGILCDGHIGAFGLLELPSAEKLNAVSLIIAEKEQQALATGTTTRKYINVFNLQQTLLVDKNTAKYNQYVRDMFRAYYVYTGSNWSITKKNEAGTYVLYSIDGVSVKCFDSTLNPANSVILPVYSNGYMTLTLCKKKM